MKPNTVGLHDLNLLLNNPLKWTTLYSLTQHLFSYREKHVRKCLDYNLQCKVNLKAHSTSVREQNTYKKVISLS